MALSPRMARIESADGPAPLLSIRRVSAGLANATIRPSVASRCAPLLAFAWFAAASSPRPEPPLYHHEATRLSMACVYAIDAYGPDAAALPSILDDAFDEVDRID